jgi:3-hydroxyisobutyrate dehydrogenase-like beta-hydroxyacid dehydrogenase
MIADEKYEPAGFQLRLGFKDVRLAGDAAREIGTPMPLASLLHDRFLQAIAQGDAELDWTAIAKVSARNAGL